MPELTGWLLDLYDHPQDEVVLWLLAEDGQRVRLRQTFPLTFYVAADQETGLQSAQRFLESQPLPVELYRTCRRDLFQAQPLDVLAVRSRACDQNELFRQLVRRQPDLTYYDTDLPLGLHHAARYDTFPLAHCRIDCQRRWRGAGYRGAGHALGDRRSARSAARAAVGA